jgi:hypothetical protein
LQNEPPIVNPFSDEGIVSGVGIFNVDIDPEVFRATVFRSKKIMPTSDYHDKEASHDREICMSISRMDAGSKCEKDRKDLSEYVGALKDSPLLDSIEADARMIRETAKPRS